MLIAGAVDPSQFAQIRAAQLGFRKRKNDVKKRWTSSFNVCQFFCAS
jgi:hypothetical protein